LLGANTNFLLTYVAALPCECKHFKMKFDTKLLRHSVHTQTLSVSNVQIHLHNNTTLNNLKLTIFRVDTTHLCNLNSLNKSGEQH